MNPQAHVKYMQISELYDSLKHDGIQSVLSIPLVDRIFSLPFFVAIGNFYSRSSIRTAFASRTDKLTLIEVSLSVSSNEAGLPDIAQRTS